MNKSHIILGNCIDVLHTLPPIDLIVTSPPYDDIRLYGGHKFDWKSVLTACSQSITDGGVIVWIVADSIRNKSETGTSFRQALYAMDSCGLKLHDTMIYQKLSFGAGMTLNRYFQVFEYMFVFSRGVPKTANLIHDVQSKHPGDQNSLQSPSKNKEGFRSIRDGIRTTKEKIRRTNIWQQAVGWNHSSPGFEEAHNHPAIFPYNLARDHIITWSNPGDLVVDPMAGSGTTVRAAMDLGRYGIGIEIYEPYVEIARRRLSQQVLEFGTDTNHKKK